MKEKIVMKMVLEIMITSEKESFITKDIRDSIKLNFGYELTTANIGSVLKKLKETTDLIEIFSFHGKGFQYKLVNTDHAILYYEELKDSEDVKNSLLNLISIDEFNTSSEILGMYCSGRGSKSERMNFTLTGIIRFVIKKKSYFFNSAHIISMFPGASSFSGAIVSNINYMRKLGMIIDDRSGFLGLSIKLKNEILKRIPERIPEKEPVVESEVVEPVVEPVDEVVSEEPSNVFLDSNSVGREITEYILACQEEIKRLSLGNNTRVEELQQKYQDQQLVIHKLRQENINLSNEVSHMKNHFIPMSDFNKKIERLKTNHSIEIKDMVEKFDDLSEKAKTLFDDNKKLIEKKANITLTRVEDLKKSVG